MHSILIPLLGRPLPPLHYFDVATSKGKKKCERPSLKNFFLLGGGIFIQFCWLTALLGLIRRAGNVLAPSD
jgi:hypothetical protein